MNDAEAALEHLELPVNGMTLRALAAGPKDGRVILLLHGFPQSSHEWAAQLPALGRARHRAVAPDQRGYSPGARPESVEAYSIDTLVADVAAMCHVLGAEQVDLVGHDWRPLWRGPSPLVTPGLLRTLTVLSVPHPPAFADAYESDTSKQSEMSAYIEVFRGPSEGAHTMLSDLDGMFRALGLSVEAATAHAVVHAEPSGLDFALNWYRATHPTKMRGYPTLRCPRFSFTAQKIRPSPARLPMGARSTSMAPISTRSSKASTTGFRNSSPSASTNFS